MWLRRFAPLLLLLPLFACDGGDKKPPLLPPPDPPTNNPPQQNPCVAALAQAVEPDTAGDAGEIAGKGRFGFGADERDVVDLLWRSAIGARAANRAAPAPDAITQDINGIAVIEDDGTLLLPRNTLDVRNVGLRFERNAGGGYDVTAADTTFRDLARRAR